MTKQQALQEILRKQGLCVTCGKLAAPSTRTPDGYSRYCEIHKEKMRNYARNYMRKYRIIER